MQVNSYLKGNNMYDETTVLIDDVLADRVRARLGVTEGEVKVTSEEWDLGFCDTCSYPEEGFAVYLNDKLVYPNDEKLSAVGGYVYADADGAVRNNALTSWGVFFDWLEGKDLNEAADARWG